MTYKLWQSTNIPASAPCAHCGKPMNDHPLFAESRACGYDLTDGKDHVYIHYDCLGPMVAKLIGKE